MFLISVPFDRLQGTLCPYRHEPSALGHERTCPKFKIGQCVDAACSMRHMNIEKARSKIQCYWESKPSGCCKPHCVFKHTKRQNNNNNVTTAPEAVPQPMETETTAAGNDYWPRSIQNQLESKFSIGLASWTGLQHLVTLNSMPFLLITFQSIDVPKLSLFPFLIQFKRSNAHNQQRTLYTSVEIAAKFGFTYPKSTYTHQTHTHTNWNAMMLLLLLVLLSHVNLGVLWSACCARNMWPIRKTNKNLFSQRKNGIQN